VNRVQQACWRGGIGTLLLTLFLAFAPLTPAEAYIDPNSAGTVYQFLFPLIVAITSAIAGFRRSIVALWNRLKGTRTASARGESASSDAERGT
jgi:hypothetical protein